MSLLAISMLIWACSLSCVRHRKWELFSYTHLLYYLFIIGMVVHGSDTWLNPGFPLSAPFALVSIVFLLFTFMRRQLQARLHPCQVKQVLSAPDLSFIYLRIKRNRGMVIEPGQYMLLNLPHYSRYQWHPFSVCSGREDPTVNFIIKNNGDFSRFLIYFFKEGRRDIDHSFNELSKLNKKRLAIVEPETRLDIVNSYRRFSSSPTNLNAFKLNLCGPFGAPCQSAGFKKNVVLIGAGVGITPYLAFLRTLPVQNSRATFVFICREPALMRWISLSFKERNITIRQRRKIKIVLYLTRRKETHSLATFLFWRAFLALKKKQKSFGESSDMLLGAPITISYRRPDLRSILEEAGKEVQKGEAVSVYSCAPKALNEELRGLCKSIGKEMLVPFDYYPEIFT